MSSDTPSNEESVVLGALAPKWELWLDWRVMVRFIVIWAAVLMLAAVATSQGSETSPPGAVPRTGSYQVIVIPITENVDTPLLFIVRRGLKQAIDSGADFVVLDMKTPGGALDVTLEIMEAIGKFPGTTISYVNDEALSAGAFIAAATDEIWFSPGGVMGAAAPVLATGQDLDETMRQKVVGYLRAKIRATTEGMGYRGEVLSAMIDPDFELRIGDELVKGRGELLTLTAKEAWKSYGDPPEPLLAEGIETDISALLDKRLGGGRYAVSFLEVTWSESLAVFLRAIGPILLGAGLLALYVELKTPGFGIFGFAGLLLLVLLFLSNYVAGLSGHEPALVFAMGLILVVVEVAFFPGIVFVALSGVVLMLGSLVWSMADLWPNEPIDFTSGVFVGPILSVLLGLLIALVGAVTLAAVLPRRWFWGRMVLNAAVSGDSRGSLASAYAGEEAGALFSGKVGVAVTALRPGGQIEIDGRRYEATVLQGHAAPGDRVVVTGSGGFGLIVERTEK